MHSGKGGENDQLNLKCYFLNTADISLLQDDHFIFKMSDSGDYNPPSAQSDTVYYHTNASQDELWIF